MMKEAVVSLVLLLQTGPNISINYTDDVGLVKINGNTFCMYGWTKELDVGEVKTTLGILTFDPTMLLKQYPELRTVKAIKAAAAWLHAHNKAYISHPTKEFHLPID